MHARNLAYDDTDDKVSLLQVVDEVAPHAGFGAIQGGSLDAGSVNGAGASSQAAAAEASFPDARSSGALACTNEPPLKVGDLARPLRKVSGTVLYPSPLLHQEDHGLG